MTDKHNVIAQVDKVPVHSIMHPMVEKMLSTNPTPEALEKLLAMQREWEAGEAKRAYTAALVELKRALPPFLLRDKKVEFLKVKYTHTSLAGAMETVQPHLAAHGFSLTWRPGTDSKGGVTVTAILTHRQGHSEEATLCSPPDMSGSKSAAQGIASTITLLQRYSALAILGLATADMTEPVGQPVPDASAVDTARNMRAMTDLVKGGKTREAVVAFVGKPLNEWTAQDLDKLRAWVTPGPATEGEKSATPDTKITKEAAKRLKGIMDGWKMKPEEFATLIEGEIGRKLQGGAMDLSASEFEGLMYTFDRIQSGEYSLRSGKIERP